MTMIKAPFKGYGTPNNIVKCVHMTVDEFFALPEYSSSVPTVTTLDVGFSTWFKPEGRFPVKMWRRDLDAFKPVLSQRATYDSSRYRVLWYELDTTDPNYKYQKTAEVRFTTTLSLSMHNFPQKFK